MSQGTAQADLTNSEWQEFETWVEGFGWRYLQSYSWEQVSKKTGKVTVTTMYVYGRDGNDKFADQVAGVPSWVGTVRQAQDMFLGAKTMFEFWQDWFAKDDAARGQSKGQSGSER